jgi:hypothetical protein
MFLDKSTGGAWVEGPFKYTHFIPQNSTKIAEVKIITSFQIQDGFQNKQLLLPKITVDL